MKALIVLLMFVSFAATAQAWFASPSQDTKNDGWFILTVMLDGRSGLSYWNNPIYLYSEYPARFAQFWANQN